MNRQIEEFLGSIRTEVSAAIAIDEPANERGEWWIDLEIDGLALNVSWSEAVGFGIYTDASSYGGRPQEIYRDSAEASARVLQLAAQWRRQSRIHALRLKELRHLVGVSQSGLAVSLGTDQARISRLENGADMKLSALINYLHAIGGTLELKAHFPRFDALIEPIEPLHGIPRVKQDA